MKKIICFIAAVGFLVGCQGQYPEHEVVDNACKGQELVTDSARMVILYQPLDSGVRYDGSGGYQPNPAKFIESYNTVIYSHHPAGTPCGSFKYFSDCFQKQIIQADSNYPCGYYQIKVIDKKGLCFTIHFTKCNPNFLGRN